MSDGIDGLWKEVIALRNDLEALRRERDDAVASKNQAYLERNRLVAFLSALFPSYLARHPEADKQWENDWRWIVFIETPQGQLSWHIHDSHLEMFKHLKEQPNEWDGHTTEEKYRRLEGLMTVAGATPKPTTLEMRAQLARALEVPDAIKQCAPFKCASLANATILVTPYIADLGVLDRLSLAAAIQDYLNGKALADLEGGDDAKAE